METTIKTNQAKTSTAVTKAISETNLNFWNKMEFNRYGIISLLVILIGCVGGIAASFGAGEDAIKISMVALPSIIALSMILSVSPMKAIIYSSVIAVLLDLFVLIF